ncbi:MAG TPA: toll/interleukin-1 receptor domain-containing protein, partial [Polyangia bacterium]|nr:toll/interleukin-1 receptor domain-containing protein [Polyangia bacterium]
MAAIGEQRPPGPLELCEERGFRYAVFISWTHESNPWTSEIVSKIARALDESFRNYIRGSQARVFLDSQRLEAGYRWDRQIRLSACRSAVTIAILIPTYFDSEYCKIEWGIAAALEALRVPAGTSQTCIIPLQLVQSDELIAPDQVKAVQFRKEFEDLLVWGRDVETHPDWRNLINRLRRSVFDHISSICLTTRDWQREEQIALTVGPFPFSWSPA